MKASVLRLPTKLRVRINECHINAPNAFYSPSEWTIQICYEWIDHGERTAPAVVSPEGVTREEAAKIDIALSFDPQLLEFDAL